MVATALRAIGKKLFALVICQQRQRSVGGMDGLRSMTGDRKPTFRSRACHMTKGAVLVVVRTAP
jgi:hypothetical protein